MKLSICIPVHNEEKHLDECLSALAFADEIVIALDKCTDGSKEIALKHNAVILEGSWQLEGDRRNEIIAKTTGDWLLEVDADERVTPELAQEIRHVIETTKHDYHCIALDNYIGKRLVRYGWGAYMGVSQKVLLFRKGAKTYQKNDRHTHARPILNGTIGPVLKERLVHYVDKDLSDTIRRFNNYTDAGAFDLIAKNDYGSFGRHFLRIFSRFYKCYILRKGYREGDLGFFIAVLAGLYPMVSYLKAKYR